MWLMSARTVPKMSLSDSVMSSILGCIGAPEMSSLGKG